MSDQQRPDVHVPAHTYDESKVKTLSSLEHIRTRPGMYIGRLGNGSHPDDGVYLLLKEVIDNAVDEFIMGAGKRIEVEIQHERCIRVRDFGRGIPLGKLIDCVSEINTGAKYNDDVFQFSVGLNGVGTKAVNALASWFQVTTCREGQYRRAVFGYGELQDEEQGETSEPAGTEVCFIPDDYFFPHFYFDEKIVRRRLWNYAYLNSGLEIRFNGEKIISRNGLLDFLNEKVSDERTYDVISYRNDQLEFAFCHTGTYGETYYSFVNGQYTNDGGTHQSAFREGILKGINEYAGRNYEPSDVRNGIIGAIAVKLKEPVFESQTKNKLGNTEIRQEIVSKVQDVVVSRLYKNPEIGEKILSKIAQNEEVRKEIQAVRKQAREKSKKAALKIPKLRDCKYHLPDDTEMGHQSTIFLTEGQSAAGSMIRCRDVNTQAVFCLKGKPLNCHGHKSETVYRNDELYYIMRALGIEESMDNLRYAKIVLATDADVDGLHIRNLLITYFLTFFEQLVLSERLYILETPLYRVRTPNKTIYAYNEYEKEEALRELGKKAETTRFKGLGEISPDEFGRFIKDDIRLLPVTVESMHSAPELLDFFMGKNRPQRRSFIMENLVETDGF